MAVMMLLLHHHGYPSSLRNKDERWKIRRKTPQPQQMLQAQMVCKEREREKVANAERLHATKSDLEPAQRERRALLQRLRPKLQDSKAAKDISGRRNYEY
jgi:hypothetical protein